MPCDSAAAYHSFATNAASAQAAESSAAQGSASLPRTTPGSIVHAAESHLLEGATHQRPVRADKEPSSRSSSLMSHAAWSRDRPRPVTEASDIAGHLHGMSPGPVRPLKQVRPMHLMLDIAVSVVVSY